MSCASLGLFLVVYLLIIITSTRYYEWEYTSTLLFILTCTYSPLSFSYYCTTIHFYGPYTLQFCYLLLVVIVVHQILFCHLKKILWQYFCCTVSLFSSLSAPPLSLLLCGMFLLFSLMHMETAYWIVSFSAFLLAFRAIFKFYQRRHFAFNHYTHKL